MMATVPHVTSGLGLRKFQADAFLLTRVNMRCNDIAWLLLHQLPLLILRMSVFYATENCI